MFIRYQPKCSPRKSIRSHTITIFFEDFEVGSRSTPNQSYCFTAEEIISFAKKWDPMPFHIDEAAAKASPLGSLFASSTHVIAAAIKLSHNSLDVEFAAVAGLGWDNVRFLSPVLAGDELRIITDVIDKRESNSKPDRGVVTLGFSLINQRDQTALTFTLSTLVLKKKGFKGREVLK